jgi:Zn-dependent M28 family amino/carboxypeptidase
MLKRLIEKQVAAVIWTDVRYTAPWNLRVGLPFTFLHLLKFPAASVPHSVEAGLVQRGADRVRLELKSVVKTRPSQNVFGEIPGKSADGGVIVTGHHDTVIDSVGAEDNAVGVGIALAVAEALKGMEFEKPVKFASFGTEEQLSQGAFAYVAEKKHRAEALDMVLNVDAMGSWTGENEIYLIGSPELRKWTEEKMAAARWSGRILEEPEGFSDHFPFIVRNVPAAWFHRRNCAGGRWFHHSQYDNMAALSPKVLEACANLVGQMAVEICTSQELPFERELPLSVKDAVRRVKEGWGA